MNKDVIAPPFSFHSLCLPVDCVFVFASVLYVCEFGVASLLCVCAVICAVSRILCQPIPCRHVGPPPTSEFALRGRRLHFNEMRQSRPYNLRAVKFLWPSAPTTRHYMAALSGKQIYSNKVNKALHLVAVITLCSQYTASLSGELLASARYSTEYAVPYSTVRFVRRTSTLTNASRGEGGDTSVDRDAISKNS